MDSVRDPERVAAVRATQLLDTAPEEPFDRLAAHAAALLDAPLAFVSLVDDRRAFWKSVRRPRPGRARRGASCRSASRSAGYVVGDGEPLLVGDARNDARTRGTGAIAALGIVGWAGHPIRSADGHVLGALCVGDTRPREWTRAARGRARRARRRGVERGRPALGAARPARPGRGAWPGSPG